MVVRSNVTRVGLRVLVGVAIALAGAVAYHVVGGGSLRWALQNAFFIVGGLTIAVSIYSFTGGASLLEDHLGVATYYRRPQPADNATVAELVFVAVLLIGAGLGIKLL